MTDWQFFLQSLRVALKVLAVGLGIVITLTTAVWLWARIVIKRGKARKQHKDEVQ